MDKDGVFEFPMGKLFDPSKRGLSFVCALLAGFSVVMGVYVVTFFFILIIIILLFSKKGIIVDTNQREYYVFISLFGMRNFGNHKPVDEYAAVSVLKSSIIYRMSSRSNRIAVTGNEKTFNIVLLCNKHIMKYVLGKFDSQEEAVKNAKLLGEKLGFPYQNYDPQIGRHAKTYSGGN